MRFPLDSSPARLVWFTQAPSSCSKHFGEQVQLAQGVTPHISPSQSCLLLSFFLNNCIFNSSIHGVCSLRGDTAICSLTSAFVRSLCPLPSAEREWTFLVFGIQINWKGWQRTDWQRDFFHLASSLFYTHSHFLSAHLISLLRMGRYWRLYVWVCLRDSFCVCVCVFHVNELIGM